jgi:hypothetical protein
LRKAWLARRIFLVESPDFIAVPESGIGPKTGVRNRQTNV